MSTDLLAEVRAAAEALEFAQARRLAAVRSAKDSKAGTVEQIADAARMTPDGIYKLLRRSDAAWSATTGG